MLNQYKIIELIRYRITKSFNYRRRPSCTELRADPPISHSRKISSKIRWSFSVPRGLSNLEIRWFNLHHLIHRGCCWIITITISPNSTVIYCRRLRSAAERRQHTTALLANLHHPQPNIEMYVIIY